MKYFDVLFPLDLVPLTYGCPDHLSGMVGPGIIVSAPLRNRTAKGIVLRETAEPAGGRIRELVSIEEDTPPIGEGLLRLFEWMAEYYIASAGSVLHQAMPRETFTKTKARKRRCMPGRACPYEIVRIPETETGPVLEGIRSGRFRPYMLLSPSRGHEYSFGLSLLEHAKNAIVLLPEVSMAEAFFPAVIEKTGERACLLHGEMPAGARSQALAGIAEGRHTVVVGTRAALFSPLRGLSLIIVLHEHSSSYKIEEGIRYSIRDTAVMRGFFENAAVVLSSVTPSVDSFYNAMTKKYRLISPGGAAKARTNVLDMRFEKKEGRHLARSVVTTARKMVGRGQGVLFHINRKGYSTMMLCGECGHVEACPDCSVPLIMHKGDVSLRCRYCGRTKGIPDRCGRCSGIELEPVGAGTQRIQEEIGRLLGIGPLRFDSDEIRKGSDISDALRKIEDGSVQVVVATKMLTNRVRPGRFGLVAVLNMDSALNFPDFRASEKAYADLASLAELVSPGGEMMVQTRFPQSPLYSHFRKRDYPGFVREELRARKELGYPPYAKLIEIHMSGVAQERIAEALKGIGGNIEALGPAASTGRKGAPELVLLLKGKERKALNEAARKIIGSLSKEKEADVSVDVDPL